MDCLSEDALVRFIGGELADDTLAEVDRHIDGCPACRQLLAELARAAGPPRQPDRPDPAAGAAELTRGDSLGRYLILAPLGAGRGGVVHAAYDPELDRRIALKLLPGRGSLLREAQALARLSHPNLIAVHDAGALGDQLFIAMELCEGGTLADWLRAGPHSWREVVELFSRAGRGLAAAHAAGLVHGDFTPANVLRGRDGAIRVTDFGLRGEPTDPRADQHSFCAALHEGLQGAVPPWLRRVVLRGLAADPAARWPSMDALLAALARDPGQRWRRLAAVALAAALGAGAVAALGAGRSAAPPCRGGAGRLAGVWDGARKAAVRAGLTGAPAPYAGAAWTGVERAVDQYAAAWAAMHDDACAATRVRGEQSDELLGLRMLCLERRRDELGALTELLASGDPALADGAVRAAYALRPLATCADAAALTAVVRPPEDPAARARVDQLRRALARVKALSDTGLGTVALPPAHGLAAAARQLGYAPLEAEALARLASAQYSAGLFPECAASERAAAAAADRGGDDRARVEAWSWLVYVEGFILSDFAAAHRSAEQAEAALARLGGDPASEEVLRNCQGALAFAEGRFREALALHRRALALIDASRGLDHPDRAMALTGIGRAHFELGDYEAGRAALTEALAVAERIQGADHPDYAIALDNLSSIETRFDHHDEAIATLRRAIAIRETALGPDHPALAGSYLNLGSLLSAAKRDDEARRSYERAAAIYRRVYGERHRDSALADAALAACLLALGHLDEAEAAARRALAVQRELLGDRHPDVADTMATLSVVLLEGDCPAEAEPLLRQVIEIRLATYGPSYAWLFDPYVDLGTVLARRGDHAGALAEFERAVALAETADISPVELARALTGGAAARIDLGRAGEAIAPLERALPAAEADGVPIDRAATRFALARALWASGGDRARARALARAARDDLPAGHRQRAAVDAWLRARNDVSSTLR